MLNGFGLKSYGLEPRIPGHHQGSGLMRHRSCIYPLRNRERHLAVNIGYKGSLQRKCLDVGGGEENWLRYCYRATIEKEARVSLEFLAPVPWLSHDSSERSWRLGFQAPGDTKNLHDLSNGMVPYFPRKKVLGGRSGFLVSRACQESWSRIIEPKPGATYEYDLGQGVKNSAARGCKTFFNPLRSRPPQPPPRNPVMFET